ncbi:hypothetical protein Zmor_023635 [Zophobas morio]|uniref:Protease inhibitor n=1 Tax=Zophobas morio TaxID=2755281 RepID=A0AA38HYZ2_9CUCU|nr:hypothetical protein Zmor_023635 [Zophobas morio]
MNVYLFAVILLVCVFTINAVPRNKAQCISGQYKNEGCSSCRCINGKWSCISNSGRCPPSQRAKRDEFTCTPGQTFKKDCNTCTCTQDGKNAICTLKRCNVVANVTQ